MTGRPSLQRRQAGVSYVEVLAAMILIALISLPALEALTAAVQGATANAESAESVNYLTGRFEEVLADSFSLLESEATGTAVPSSFSDAPGSDNRRLVFIAAYDGDNADGDNDPFTGTDDGILWLRIELENSPLAFETVTSK